MKKIYLSGVVGRGKYTIVDDEDFEVLSKYSWHLTRAGYARNGSGIGMHKIILNPAKGLVSDHINGDRLDNRRANLRICTPKQNRQNKGMYKNNKSGYRGVCWDKYANLWRVDFSLNGKHITVGYFKNPEDGHKAYKKRSIKEYGEFRRL